jgi:lipoprotein-anchoring transpeptidase ErfK/SrfK
VGCLVVLVFCFCLSAEAYNPSISSKERHNILNKKVLAQMAKESHRSFVPETMWDGDMLKKEGKLRIEIYLKEQIARLYKGDHVVGETSVCTGMKGHETKVGKFEVLEKEEKHISNLYGEFVNAKGKVVGYGASDDPAPKGAHYEASPMPHYMRILYDGTGMHAGFLPGFPASHGCIRMPEDMATKFYENTPVGTPVEVFEQKPG